MATEQTIPAARSFLAMFDSCEVYETAAGFEITANSAYHGEFTVSTHETKGAAYDAAQEYDDSEFRRRSPAQQRPVDQRHYQTGHGVGGEPMWMPDR